MRKILSLILAFLTVVALFSSCGDENVGKNEETEPMITDNPVQTYENVSCWATYSYDKIRGEKKAPEDGSTAADVYLARNEAEGATLCVRSPKDINEVTLTRKSGEYDTVSYTVYQVFYVTVVNEKQKFSDPMRDYKEGDKVDIKADESLCFYVEFKTDNTPAGKYDYVFELKDSAGNVISTYDIALNVWNFSYPETPSLTTSMGLWDTRFVNWYGFCGEAVYKTAYDFMLEHKISSYDLPYDILDDRADAYMSDPRVTSFCVRWRGAVDVDKIDKIYEKLKSNPVWMEKAILYAKDEPHTAEHFEFIRKEFPKYKERWPELKIIVPFCVNRQAGPGEDQLDFLSKYVDIVCPVSRAFGDDPDFPTYYERLMNLKENGKVIWSYTANLPGDPYANIQIDMKGLTNRVVFWQTYQHNTEGFLYWCVNNWLSSEDVWKDGNGEGNWWGDGMLIYPGIGIKYGYTFRQTEPFPSIRLKIVRDGIEDFDLLKMAEEKLGSEWIEEKLNAVSSNMKRIDANNDEFAQIRIEIGNALSTAMSE